MLDITPKLSNHELQDFIVFTILFLQITHTFFTDHLSERINQSSFKTIYFYLPKIHQSLDREAYVSYTKCIYFLIDHIHNYSIRKNLIQTLLIFNVAQ